MSTKELTRWWKAALIRAGRTAAQTALSVIGVGAVMSDVDWIRVGSASVMAAILSILTAVAWGIPEADPAEDMSETGQGGGDGVK